MRNVFNQKLRTYSAKPTVLFRIPLRNNSLYYLNCVIMSIIKDTYKTNVYRITNVFKRIHSEVTQVDANDQLEFIEQPEITVNYQINKRYVDIVVTGLSHKKIAWSGELLIKRLVGSIS